MAEMHYINDYLEWLLHQPLAPETKRIYRSLLSNYFQTIGAKTFSQSLIDSAIMQQALRSRELRNSSCKTLISVLRHYCKFKGVPFESKVQNAKGTDRLPRILTQQEQTKFLLAAESYKCKRDSFVCLLLLSYGLRMRECAALNIDDVEFRGTDVQLTVRWTSNRGSSMVRTVLLKPPMACLIRAWLAERSRLLMHTDSDEQALLVSAKHTRLSVDCIDLIVRKIGVGARLVVSGTVLRNSFLANMAREGSAETDIAEVGGFTTLSVARKFYGLAGAKN